MSHPEDERLALERDQAEAMRQHREWENAAAARAGSTLSVLGYEAVGDFGDGGWMDKPEQVTSTHHGSALLPTIVDPNPYGKFYLPPDDNAEGEESMGRGKRRHKEKSFNLHQMLYTGWLIVTDIVDGAKKFLGVVEAEGPKWVWTYLSDRLEEWPLELREGQKEEDREFGLIIPEWMYAVEKKLKRVHTFSPGPCVFDSTSDYLKNILGVNLHHTDRDYFMLLPHLEPHGTPTPYTPQTIQEVIDPYGLRVCKIRSKAGVHMNGDISHWMQYLGCNPLGAQDYRTTNAQFAESIGMDPREADALFGFEFHTEPLRPSVVCEAYAGHQFDRPVGHASFLAPRAKCQDWWVSIQIDRSPWPNPAVRPHYPVREQQYEEIPDLFAIKRNLDAYEDAKRKAEQQKLLAAAQKDREAATGGQV